MSQLSMLILIHQLRLPAVYQWGATLSTVVSRRLYRSTDGLIAKEMMLVRTNAFFKSEEYYINLTALLQDRRSVVDGYCQ